MAARIKEPAPAEIDAIFKEFDRPDSPGCSVAIEHKGAIVYAKGYGMANLEFAAANTPDTVFHIASLSKQVTAFAIQLLVEDGRVRLDDDAGYRTESLVFPDNDFSIVCFANVGSAKPSALARQVADLYLGDVLAPVSNPEEAVPVDPKSLAQYAGTYGFDPGRIGQFSVREGKFEVTFGDDDPIELGALSASQFRIPGVGRCEFVKVRGGYDCKLTSSDVSDLGRRLAPIEQGEDLTGCVGEFYSEELQAFCRVNLDGVGLKVSYSKSEEALKPLAKDVYCFGSRTARFARNRNGRAVRVFISTSRSFNVRFDRMR